MISKLDLMRLQHNQLAEPCPEWWAFVRQHKLDLKAFELHCGIFGVALCKSYQATNGTSVFEFSPDGVACAVIEAICFRREEGVINPYTADLVAWPLHAPEHFATALGTDEGSQLLGAWSGYRIDPNPITIHRTPLAWLKAGCEGCVILKPDAQQWLENAGGPFICEDTHHAREVANLFGEKVVPEILIPKTGRAA